MSIKLIGIDIDGTLLNSRKELTQATIDALQAAADHGIQVVISTGRLLSEYVDLVAQLPMMRYNVTCTGTQVLDLQTGEDIFRCAMTADELRYLCGKLRGLDCFLQIFSDVDGKIHNDVRHMAQAERFCGEGLARMVRNHHVAEPDIYEYIEGYTGVTNKIHIFFADPAVKAEAIRRMEGEPYAVMGSAPNDLELMPLGIDKAVGLRKLADHLGLDRSEIMTFGDGGNDVAMLAYAGVGLAMKNASQDAKEAADYVLPWTNDEDGVAKAVWALLKE